MNNTNVQIKCQWIKLKFQRPNQSALLNYHFLNWNIPGTELSGQLDHWLNQAELTYGPARAIIAPHAGYSYCGACGAFAYRQVSPAVV